MMNSYWHKLLDLRDSQLRHILMCFRQWADPNSLSTVTEKQNIQAPPLYFFLCRTLNCPIRYKAREIDDVLRCFVENGADLNRQNEDGDTILHLLAKYYSRQRGLGYSSCSQQDLDMYIIISSFIMQGADLNRQNKEGNTILHLLAQQMECKKEENPLILLLKHNANIELMNEQNHTFLDVLGRHFAFNILGCVDFLEILHEVKDPFAVMRFAESKFAREQLPYPLMNCIGGGGRVNLVGQSKIKREILIFIT